METIKLWTRTENCEIRLRHGHKFFTLKLTAIAGNNATLQIFNGNITVTTETFIDGQHVIFRVATDVIDLGVLAINNTDKSISIVPQEI